MPSLATAFAIALAGWSWRVESGPATWPEAPISASQVEAELLGLRLAHHHDRAGAVGDLRCGAGRDGAVLGDRAQTGERLHCRVATDALVLGDRHRRPCGS